MTEKTPFKTVEVTEVQASLIIEALFRYQQFLGFASTLDHADLVINNDKTISINNYDFMKLRDKFRQNEVIA